MDAGDAGDDLDLGDPNVRPHADRDDEADEIDDGDPTDAPDPKALTNGRLARVFHEIGDILELKGKIKFKTVAYHRAADAIARAPFDVAGAYRAATEAGEKPPPISGVGAAISDKLVELSTTGRLVYHERLRAEIPPASWACLRIPGLGPKTVKLIYEQLGVETLDDLRQAAEAHTLQGLKGVSASTEQRILDGIRRLESQPRRLLISRAQALADDLVAYLRSYEGVHDVHIAGSLRRRKETIGDLDLLVETDRPDEVIERFVAHGSVDKVVGRGHYKAAVTLIRGPNVDLMVMPPGQAGSYLVHFTGSAAHNTHLRGMARDRGWSLSEKGYVRLTRKASRCRDRPPTFGRSRARRRSTASSTSRSSNPSCARTTARWRRPSPAACRRSSPAPTCAVTSTRTATGRTGSTRSRSWPRPPVARATATRC